MIYIVRMRIFTVFFFWLLMLVLPLPLWGQLAQELLPKVAEALSGGKDDYAVSLFRQSAKADAERAEMFYWTRVDKNGEAAPRLARELASRYRDLHNFDKAYLFCQEFLQRRPNEVPVLALCAEMQLMRGKEKDALRLYEKVLAMDADHLQANIFLGNYFFLQAEKEKKALEEDYRKIASPTRMQYARYRNGLSDIFTRTYSKARVYLQRVMSLFPSTEAGRTLEKIQRLEEEMR